MTEDIITPYDLPSHQRYKGGRPRHRKPLLDRSPPPTKEQMKGVVTPRRRTIKTFDGKNKLVKGVVSRTNKETGKTETREVQYGGFDIGGRYKDDETIQRNIQWYRQWFSWLQLALSMEGEELLERKVKVSRSYYEEWSLDEIPFLKFGDWWKDHRQLFQSPKVELISGTSESDIDSFFVKIPKNRNHNEIVKEVNDLLKGKMKGNSSKFPFKRNDTTPYLKIHQQWNILLLSRNGCSQGTVMNWMNDKYSHLYEDKMRELDKKGVVGVLPVVSTPQGLSRSLRKGKERIHRVGEGVFP